MSLLPKESSLTLVLAGPLVVRLPESGSNRDPGVAEHSWSYLASARWAADPQDRGDSGRRFQMVSAATLPDPAICRAEALGITEYAACLVEGVARCPYALSFGWSFLCRHPHRQEIIMRTAARGW